jgi:hypothetical protein
MWPHSSRTPGSGVPALPGMGRAMASIYRLYSRYRELVTKAMRLLSGDQEGTFIVPWPP